MRASDEREDSRMARFFTHYWTNDTCERSRCDQGYPLDYTAGNQFAVKGIGEVAEDYIYAVTIRQGNLYLIGRMRVKGPSIPCAAAGLELKTRYGPEAEPYYPATDHLLAEAATTIDFERLVPTQVARQLRFVVPGSSTTRPPKFVPGDGLDRQTLRDVRQLTAASASALDALLEPTQRVDWTRGRVRQNLQRD
jgi:hypothetical protein